MTRSAAIVVLSFFVFGATAWSQGPVPPGDEFQFNSYTTGSQSAPAIAAEPGGTFVLVYGSYGSPDSDTSRTSARGQRLERGTVVLFSAFETADTSEWSSTVR